MLLNNRIIFSDNGTLTDLTGKLNNYSSETESLGIVSAEDALFVGSTLPFNHRFFEVVTANATACDISVSLWNGDAFEAAVDVSDFTKSDAGAAFADSGHVSWVLEKGKSWARQDTDGMTGTDLASLKIYDLYWAKITFSADITAELRYAGQKFGDDQVLGEVEPQLDDAEVRKQFNNNATKDDWSPQFIAATQIMINDIENLQKGLFDGNQIIRWDRLKYAAVYKVAELVYGSWGGDEGSEKRTRYKAEYREALDLFIMQIDQNKNTRLDSEERENSEGLAVYRR